MLEKYDKLQTKRKTTESHHADHLGRTVLPEEH